MKIKNKNLNIKKNLKFKKKTPKNKKINEIKAISPEKEIKNANLVKTNSPRNFKQNNRLEVNKEISPDPEPKNPVKKRINYSKSPPRNLKFSNNLINELTKKSSSKKNTETKNIETENSCSKKSTEYKSSQNFTENCSEKTIRSNIIAYKTEEIPEESIKLNNLFDYFSPEMLRYSGNGFYKWYNNILSGWF